MKQLFAFLLVLLACSSVFSQARIMDCTLQNANGSSTIVTVLTDTALVYGFDIKAGTYFDGSDLLNEQYLIASLPANASFVDNAFSVSLEEINTAPTHVWVTLLLMGGGSKEIKVTRE